MVEERDFKLGLPHMRANPFSGRPIESHEWKLLAGRNELVAKFVRMLKFQSPRLVLLKGERGSGRTSLIHALASQADRHFALTMFPHGEPSRAVLEETYTTVVGFEIPNHHTQLVDQLVADLSGGTASLPLLSYDYPGASGAQLVDVFSRMTDVLRRLRALVIVTVTPSQLAAFPEELVAAFDDVEQLGVLDETHLDEFVRRRMELVSKRPWVLPAHFKPRLLEETGGHVGRMIRLLRDLVDFERGEKGLDQRLVNLHMAIEAHSFESEEFTDENSEENTQVNAQGESEVDSESAPGIEFVTFPWQEQSPSSIEDAMEAGLSSVDEPTGAEEAEAKDEATDPAQEGVKARISDILDEDDEVPWSFSMLADEESGEQTKDIPDSKMLIDSGPPSIGGMFGSLASRNRDAKSVLPPFDASAPFLPDHALNNPPPAMKEEGAELWHEHKAPLPAIEAEQGGGDASGQQPEPEILGNQGITGMQSHFEEPLPHPEGALPARLPSEQPIHSQPGQIFSGESATPHHPPVHQVGPAQPFGLAGRLSALRQPPAPGPLNSVPLNVQHLRNLAQNEAVIIETAVLREFSPSDEELRFRFAVSRSRMSQLCNGLHRSGILQVRRVGRTRMYSLTNDARAQMIAWGLMEG